MKNLFQLNSSFLILLFGFQLYSDGKSYEPTNSDTNDSNCIWSNPVDVSLGYTALLNQSHDNNSIILDGLDDYIEIQDNELFTTNNLTIEAWINTTSLNATQVIASKYNSQFPTTQGASWSLSITPTGKIDFGICDYTNDFDCIGIYSDNPIIVSGQWQHIAASFNIDNQNVNLYLNGVQVPTSFWSGDNTISEIYNSNTPMRIGTHWAGGTITGLTGFFNGKIKEFRFWNTTRNPSDIQNNFNKSLSCSELNLVTNFKFNNIENLGQGELGVNDVLDCSGNNFHGDAKGGAMITNDIPVGITEIGVFTWYLDADHDLQATSTKDTCFSPGTGYTSTILPLGDCDDNNPNIHPGATEIPCNEIDENCDGLDGICNPCPIGDTDADGICDDIDNCTTYNPLQTDKDCDGVGDACDLCDGGKDTINLNQDGKPDCAYPPSFSLLPSSWKCGTTKVYVCQYDSATSTYQTGCINYNGVKGVVKPGKLNYCGPCNQAVCINNLQIYQPKYKNSNTDFELFPNPNNGDFIINLPNIDKKLTTKIVLYNSIGQQIWTQNVSTKSLSNFRIQLNNVVFQSGVYLLQVTNGDMRYQKKVMVNK